MYSILAAVTLAGVVLHLAFDRREKTLARVAEVILLYVLAIMVGLNGVIAFIGHAFFANQIALFIGWMPGSPFQFEIAVANLAFGVLGLLCIVIRGQFWTAVVIGQSIFYWGAAYGHIHQYLLLKDTAPGNIGGPFYMDIAVPVVMIALLIAYRKAVKNS